MDKQQPSKFEEAISDSGREGVLSDFWYLLKRTKKWWLVPLLIILVALGAVMLAGGTAAAPFIYTLF